MTSAGSGTKVVKGSGETEVFDPNIITKECVEAGVEFYTAADVALEVSKDVFDGINSDEIQRRILKALFSRNPEVAERYKRFHSMYVRTSGNTIERFDRKRVVNSLVKETRLPKEVSEIIARETETELRRLNLDFTSGPLIREIVNVKLLEHGYESARSDYTRLGMPVYDAAKFIESAPNGKGNLGNPEAVRRAMANSIFREYSLLKVLPLHLADVHMKGDLHIHGLEYFVTRLYTASHDLRFFLREGLRFGGSGIRSSVAGPAKNAQTAVLQAVKALMASSANFYSLQSLPLFNVWLAPYLEGLNLTEIRQIAQTFLFELSQSFPLGGTGVTNIDLGVEYGIPAPLSRVPAVLPGGVVKEGVCYKDFEDESREFAKALTEIYLHGDYEGSSFRSPALIYNLREENADKEGYAEFMHLIHEAAANHRGVHLLNLSTSHLPEITLAHSSGLTFSGNEYSTNEIQNGLLKQSNLQCTSLNLPRAAYKSGGNDDKLFETLDEVMGLAREITDVKREVISKRIERGAFSFLDNSGFDEGHIKLERSSNIVGYVGLNEAVKAHIGEELHESIYARDFGVSIIKHVSETLSDWHSDTGMSWLLSSIAIPSVAERFAMLDTGQFSEVASVKEHGNSLSVHYSDSCHLSSALNLSPVKRLEIESPFYDLSSGGMMEVISVGDKDADALLSVSDAMLGGRAGYWSFAL